MRRPDLPADAVPAGDRVTVLAVASEHGLAQLRRIIGHSRWTLLEAPTVAEAVASLREQSSVVLICEAVLPDGIWRDMLHYAERLEPPPPVIVAASHADDFLWMEVLNRGGYNVLAMPFDDQEVFRVVSLAWLHSRGKPRFGASAQAV